MTENERRSIMEERGFAVASRPFRGKCGPTWYALELLSDGTRGGTKLSELSGRQYSVDLVGGSWNRWGTAEWFDWNAGPWIEQPNEPETAEPLQASESRSLVHDGSGEVVGEASPAQAAFVDRCIAAGFVVDGNLNQFGNVFAVRGGRRWLLLTETERIFDHRFRLFRLSELIDEPASGVGDVPVPGPPVSERPFTFQGANCQPALF